MDERSLPADEPGPDNAAEPGPDAVEPAADVSPDEQPPPPDFVPV